MNWQDTLKILAPTVASAFLGPLGGAAVAAIGGALGIDAPTQDKIAKAFTQGQLTPEAMEKIKMLELDYQNQEKERGFKFEELVFKNTADARDMQKQTRSYFPATLSVIIVIGFFGILLSMMFGNVSPSEPLLIMLGALGAAFGAVINFWLGSTSGSARTKELLAQAQLPGK